MNNNNNKNEEERIMFDGDSLFMAAVGRESAEEPDHESFRDEPNSLGNKARRNRSSKSSKLEDFIPRRTMASTANSLTKNKDDDDDQSQSSASSNFSDTKLGKLLTTRRGLTAHKKNKLEKVALRISSRRILTKKSKQHQQEFDITEEESETTAHDFLDDPEHGGGDLLDDDDDGLDLYMEAMTASNSGSRSNYFSVTKELLRVPEQQASPKAHRPSIVSKIRDSQKNQGVAWPYYDNIMPTDEADGLHRNARSGTFSGNNSNVSDKMMTVTRSRKWWMALVLALCVVITLPVVLKHRAKPQYKEAPIYNEIDDLNHIFKDPSLFHDWSDAGTKYPERSYNLHPVNETESEIAIKTPQGGYVTIFRLSTQSGKDALVNSMLEHLHGHHHVWCSETWPDVTPEHAPEGTMVILPTNMQDTQIAACVDGRLVAFAFHLYVPAWNGIKPPHELQVMDFYSQDAPAIHYEPTDAHKQFFILLISSRHYPIFMYVEKQEAIESLNDTFTKHPDDVHNCHSDNTANDPAGTIRHPVETVNSRASQLVLWDVSQIHAEQSQPTWSTLVWNCDMGANEILRPIGQLSVVNAKDKK